MTPIQQESSVQPPAKTTAAVLSVDPCWSKVIEVRQSIEGGSYDRDAWIEAVLDPLCADLGIDPAHSGWPLAASCLNN